MGVWKTLPTAGLVVIVVIAALFVLAVALLVFVCRYYHQLSGEKHSHNDSGGFRSALLKEYTAAFQKYGRDVNTPAIISDVVGNRLSKLLLCERFLNNVLDSVGGGLISALSGMGVAFYTSLVGAGSSILLIILRTILNPQAEREKLETRLELWLDTEVAPGLATESATDDAGLVQRMLGALNAASEEMQTSMRGASDALMRTAAQNRSAMEQFNATVGKFNDGVHDFSEVDYNLRGSVERMDLAVRDLANALREVNRRMEGEHR